MTWKTAKSKNVKMNLDYTWRHKTCIVWTFLCIINGFFNGKEKTRRYKVWSMHRVMCWTLAYWHCVYVHILIVLCASGWLLLVIVTHFWHTPEGLLHRLKGMFQREKKNQLYFNSEKLMYVKRSKWGQGGKLKLVKTYYYTFLKILSFQKAMIYYGH